VDGLTIPFRIEISGKGSSVKGAFLIGDQKVTSANGQFERGSLVLSLAEYAEKLQATFRDGQ
jgi:hypothetical protein